MLVRSLVQNTTSPLSSALDAVNCLHHHGVVQRLQVRLLSPLSPLLPLPTWQTRGYPPLLQWPNSDILIVNFPLTLFAHLLTKKKILRSLNKQLTSLAGSFGYVFPGVVKKYRPRKSGARVWSLPHAYTNEIQGHCSLSAQPSPPTFASAAISLSVPTTLQPSPSMPTPKWNFRVRTGNQAKPAIWRLAAFNLLHCPNVLDTLRYSWPTTTTTIDAPSHVDPLPHPQTKMEP